MKKTRKSDKKTLKSFLLPADLADWVKSYTKAHNTTMTRLIIDHLMELKRKSESDYVEQV